MKRCVFCGTDNERNALFCTGCGKKLALPGSEHDFTTGVMRYVPEHTPEEAAPPVYLNAAANAFVPVNNAVPQRQIQPMVNETRQGGRSGKATAVIIGMIALLMLLIIFGIVLVLGGFV